MTTIRRRPETDTPFGSWIRNHPQLDSIRERLSVTDSDWWIHQYRARTAKAGSKMLDNVMLVEVKTHEADVRFAQRDTLFLVNQMLRKSSVVNGRRRYVKCVSPTVGETRYVRLFGVHVLTFSGNTPVDSDRIVWDSTVIDEQILVELLCFKRDPDSPLRQLDTRLHHRPSQKGQLLQLFGTQEAV